VRIQVLTAAIIKMKAFYDIARVVSLRTAAIIALMTEVVFTSETSVFSNVTTRRYIPEGYVHNVFVLLHNFKILKNKSSATAMQEKRGRGVSIYSFLTSAQDRSDQRHAPAAFYTRGKDPRYPLYRRLSGPQSRSGHRR
jgi:hypothetical protein